MRSKLRSPFENLPGEDWRPVNIFTDYEVSNLGRIRSNHTANPRLLYIHFHKTSGYPIVRLYREGKPYVRLLRSLVSGAWMGPRPEDKVLTTLNGDEADLRVSNLKWATRSEVVKKSFDETDRDRVGKARTYLDASQESAVRSLWLAGEHSKSALGRMFNISASAICKRLRGLSRGGVK